MAVGMNLTAMAQINNLNDRALWASINGKKDASLGDYQQHTGKVLVSWRMLPGDGAETGFDLYRTIGTGTEKKIVSNIGQQVGRQSLSSDVCRERRNTVEVYVDQGADIRRTAIH